MRNPNPSIPSTTLEEAGRLLGVHPETLRKKAKKGEIPGTQIGDRWVIPRQWVADVLNGHSALWVPNAHGGLSREPQIDPFSESSTFHPFGSQGDEDTAHPRVGVLESEDLPGDR